jgi:hypothetical protein
MVIHLKQLWYDSLHLPAKALQKWKRPKRLSVRRAASAWWRLLIDTWKQGSKEPSFWDVRWPRQGGSGPGRYKPWMSCWRGQPEHGMCRCIYPSALIHGLAWQPCIARHRHLHHPSTALQPAVTPQLDNRFRKPPTLDDMHRTSVRTKGIRWNLCNYWTEKDKA